MSQTGRPPPSGSLLRETLERALAALQRELQQWNSNPFADGWLCDRGHCNRRRAALLTKKGGGIMTSMFTRHGWWDLSLVDERNERPLHQAFVAVVAALATAFLLALV
jgi:hypothetical protein